LMTGHCQAASTGSGTFKECSAAGWPDPRRGFEERRRGGGRWGGDARRRQLTSRNLRRAGSPEWGGAILVTYEESSSGLSIAINDGKRRRS